MAVFKMALVRVHNGHLQFETADPKELERIRKEIERKIETFGLTVDNTMPNSIVLSGFHTPALLINVAVWLMEKLEEKKWKHDNRADITDVLFPDASHFKKLYR